MILPIADTELRFLNEFKTFRYRCFILELISVLSAILWVDSFEFMSVSVILWGGFFQMSFCICNFSGRLLELISVSVNVQ